MSSWALEVRNLHASLDSTEVLHDVSLGVREGEITCIVGPSGAGKSTLLRCVAGLLEPAGGEVLLRGHDQRAVPVHERGLGLVAQEAALFPHLDVAGNVGFGLRMRGWARAARHARVAEVLELVELGGLAQRDVRQLSGGERQRVALARALAPNPTVLLLDEPFGSLDRTLRERLTTLLAELVDLLGVSALHVTHDQQEAAELAATLVVLRDGALVQAGAPSDLYQHPRDSWTARFLGHRNVLDSRELDAAARAALGDDAGMLVVPETALTLVDDQTNGGAEGAENRFAATVVRTQLPPGRAGMVVKFGTVELWTSLPTNDLAPGATVELRVDTSRIVRLAC